MADSFLRSVLFVSLLFISPSLISSDQPKRQNYPSARSLQEVGGNEDHHNQQTKPITKPTQTERKTKPTSKPSDLPTIKKPNKAQTHPDPIDVDDIVDDDGGEEDSVSGLRGLPSRFRESIVPDLTKISKASQIYLTRYSREFTRGIRPYVGGECAAAFAFFVAVPLIIASFAFAEIRTHFSIQRILIFAQVYLAVHFSVLGLSCFATGLEPLGFFYSASRPTYVCVQVVQTLGYALYLLLLLMYLVLAFSTEEAGPAAKALGLGQALVGLAIGLHYYVTVFHWAVLRQPPKSSWRAHGLYATCFAVICLLGSKVERRMKKAYLEGGGEEGKTS